MTTEGISLNNPVSFSGAVAKTGESKTSHVRARERESVESAARAKEENGEKVVVNEDALKQGIEKINQYIKVFNVKVSFDVDKPTGRTVVRISNNETQEVIREFPPEEFLKMAAKLSELMGLMVDQRI